MILFQSEGWGIDGGNIISSLTYHPLDLKLASHRPRMELFPNVPNEF